MASGAFLRVCTSPSIRHRSQTSMQNAAADCFSAPICTLATSSVETHSVCVTCCRVANTPFPAALNSGKRTRRTSYQATPFGKPPPLTIIWRQGHALPQISEAPYMSQVLSQIEQPCPLRAGLTFVRKDHTLIAFDPLKAVLYCKCCAPSARFQPCRRCWAFRRMRCAVGRRRRGLSPRTRTRACIRSATICYMTLGASAALRALPSACCEATFLVNCSSPPLPTYTLLSPLPRCAAEEPCMCVSSCVGHLPNLPFGCKFRISVLRGWGPVAPPNGFQWNCEGRIHILVLDHMRACVYYSPCRSQNVCRVPGPAAVLPQTPKPFSNRTTLNRVRQGPSSRFFAALEHAARPGNTEVPSMPPGRAGSFFGTGCWLRTSRKDDDSHGPLR